MKLLHSRRTFHKITFILFTTEIISLSSNLVKMLARLSTHFQLQRCTFLLN